MLQRIWAIMQKDLIQTLRDRVTLLIILCVPPIELFLFGYAITMTVDHIPTIVADQSLDGTSQAYRDALQVSGYFDIVEYAHSEADVVRAIDQGRVQVGVVIPADFAAHVEQGDAQALVLVDGSDAFMTQSAYNAALNIGANHSIAVLMERVNRSGFAGMSQRLLAFETFVRILYNPNQTNLWFAIPGMVAMILQTQTVFLTAMAVVREREVGTIEQILVTPIRPGELMLGKIVPSFLISLVVVLTILGLGIFWFDMPFRGNLALLLGLAGLFVFSSLGLGLLVSSVSRTQQQAHQLGTMIALVAVLLGGFLFPRYMMPTALQLAGDLFPMTYFIPIVRGVILKGAGMDILWSQALFLAIYGVLIMFLAVRAFRQSLD